MAFNIAATIVIMLVLAANMMFRRYVFSVYSWLVLTVRPRLTITPWEGNLQVVDATIIKLIDFTNISLGATIPLLVVMILDVGALANILHGNTPTWLVPLLIIANGFLVHYVYATYRALLLVSAEVKAFRALFNATQLYQQMLAEDEALYRDIENGDTN